MKKDHTENIVGPWAKRKLDALEDYLKFYNTALKKQKFTRVYIDAFAGAVKSKIRDTRTYNIPSLPLEGEDIIAVEQFLLGSPLRALNIKDGFHEHYFFDLDKNRAKKLNALKTEYVQKEIIVKSGDSNELIQNLAKNLSKPHIRGVAFLDPYGPHLEWNTIKALAATGTIEVIINFPIAMAINRLIPRSGDVPETWQNQLNRCFGTEEWLQIAYSKETDLFGDEITQKNIGVSERLLELYVRRLKDIFKHVASPRLIHNTNGLPLYYLIWAGPNRLGLKGADYILKQGTRIKSK